MNSHDQPLNRWNRKAILGFGLVCFSAALLFAKVVARAWVTEDAFITLRTVDQFVHGNGLVWNPGERLQVYTHPLWMFLLSFVYRFTLEAFFTTLALSLTTSFAVLLLVLNYAQTNAHRVLVLLVLAHSYSFLDFSTSGLENPLLHLLLLAFAFELRRNEELGDHRLIRIFLWASALALTRFDGLILVLPNLIRVLWMNRRDWRACLRAAAIGFSPLAAWMLFALFYYGFAFPNTAYAKLGAGIPTDALMQQGRFYLLDALKTDSVLAAFVLCFGSLALISKKEIPIAWLCGTLLYALYILRVGGDFMSGRFLSAPLIAACIGFCELSRSDFVRWQVSSRSRTGALGALFALLGLALFVRADVMCWGEDERVWEHGIVDERAFWKGLRLMDQHRGISVPSSASIEAGLRFRTQGAGIRECPNIGLIGYYAGREVFFIDALGLGDLLLARLPVPPGGYRVGHYRRTVPSGYAETIQTGTCRMDDPRLCEYYLRLRRVARDPLFSWQRLHEIARFSLGMNDRLLPRREAGVVGISSPLRP